MSEVITEELKQEFEQLNTSYIYNHGLHEEDIKSYIRIKENYKNREKRRMNNQPIEGDIIEVHSNNGHVFYKNAIVEERSHYENGIGYCEQPYIPFYDEDTHRENMSGGAFHSLDISKCEYIGETDKYIKVWGCCGACANGAFTVKVTCKRFKYTIDKKFVALCVERWADSYSSFGYKYNVRTWDKKDYREQYGCFTTITGLKKFLRNTGLKISHNKLGCWGNTHEIIGDVNIESLMDYKEYRRLKEDRKEFAWLSNGEYTGAFLRDGVVYYCNPNVKERPKYSYIHE